MKKGFNPNEEKPINYGVIFDAREEEAPVGSPLDIARRLYLFAQGEANERAFLEQITDEHLLEAAEYPGKDALLARLNDPIVNRDVHMVYNRGLIDMAKEEFARVFDDRDRWVLRAEALRLFGRNDLATHVLNDVADIDRLLLEDTERVRAMRGAITSNLAPPVDSIWDRLPSPPDLDEELTEKPIPELTDEELIIAMHGAQPDAALMEKWGDIAELESAIVYALDHDPATRARYDRLASQFEAPN